MFQYLVEVIYIGKVLEDNPIYIKELDNDIDGFCHQRKIKWFFNKKKVLIKKL